MSGRVIALTGDLIFSSNIEATLRRAGYEVASLDDLLSLERALRQKAPGLVILDLHAGPEAGAVVMLCRPLGVPVLAFGRHTEPALLRSAREAGVAEAVARSSFVEQMVELVRRHARADEGA